jgi:hypothetical protein
MVDWNGDGLKDLLVGEFSGNVRYFRNIGTPGNPQLTFQGYIQVGDSILRVDYDSTPFADDWNGDGLIDLMVGAIDGRIWLYLNVGSNSEPIFDQIRFVTLADGDTLWVGSRSAPCVLDLDGDGVKELLVGENNGNALYYENLGTNDNPLLTDPVFLMMGNSHLNPGIFSRFSGLDWEGDGTLDLVGGSYNGFLKLYRQTEFTTAAPIVYMNFQGPEVVPENGATLNFTANAENNSPVSLLFDMWAEVCGPDYRYYQIMPPPAQVNVEPGGIFSHDLMLQVPAVAPPGPYNVRLFVGDSHRNQVLGTDIFYFQKVLGQLGSAEYINPDLNLLATPNPFNHSTSLNYHLPTAGRISLQIYDLAGRPVVPLLDAWQEAGNHSLAWEASAYSSGIYFLRLRTAIGTIQTKLLLVK